MLRLVLLSLVLLVSACGPVMETSYEMVPPPTMEGRMCSNDCVSAKQTCESACRQEKNSCDNLNMTEAQNQYLLEKATNKDSTKTPDDFHGSRWCSADECLSTCGSNFNLCHSNCGGQVIPHTQCTAFCK